MEKLALRDAINAHTADKLDTLSPEERFTILHEAEIPWTQEFENYGLGRIKIDKKQYH